MYRPSSILLPLLLAACAETATPVAEADDPPLDLGTVEYQFALLQAPGATHTIAQGISDRGVVAGYTIDENGVERGFLYRDGEFTTIEYPGAFGTRATDVNQDGEVVGYYMKAGEPAFYGHAYRLTPGGEFVELEIPGHINSIAMRILPNGTALGCRHDDDFNTTMRPYVFGAPERTEPDLHASMYNGATPDMRRLVGNWTNQEASRGEGFVVTDGVVESLLYPGSQMTQAWDINAHGQIVGGFRDDEGVHGFVMDGEQRLPLDFPGATGTRAFGINRGATVVGGFVSGGRTSGFIATPVQRGET